MGAEEIPIWQSVLGGALIGAGAAVLILFDGRIAGISGILGRILQGDVGPGGWRIAFLSGLLLPALLLGPGLGRLEAPWLLLALAGLLVGFGTRLGSGCTSGHGVCGIANVSPRSLTATGIFMGVAMITVFLTRHGGIG
jgi:uncharacterized membrane protein YedE/YeeE